MAEQMFHRSWYVDLRSGEANPFAVKAGHRAWVTHAVLIDPTSAAAGQSVHVALRDETGYEQIALVLSAGRPVAPVRSTVLMDDGIWWLERKDDEFANAIVRFEGGYVVDTLATPDTETETETAEDDEDQEAVLEQEEEDDDAEAAADSEQRDEMVEENEFWYRYVDLRSGERETMLFNVKPGQRMWVSHAELLHPSRAPAGQTIRVAVRTKTDVEILVLGAGRNMMCPQSTEMLEEFWLEREEDGCDDVVVRFIVCKGDPHSDPWTIQRTETMGAETGDEVTIGDGDDISDDEEESEVFCGLFKVEKHTENQEGGSDRQILVLYRYTRFSAAWPDGNVKAHGTTKEHQLQFIADAGRWDRSLAWAGTSLADMIYPKDCSKQLRALWTVLVPPMIQRLPPGAADIKLLVEVGILRQANCTQASEGHMIDALKVMIEKPGLTRFSGIELSLPEPAGCCHEEDEAADDDDTDGEQKPAKRRRVVATGEDCSVCFELLKGDDLHAWPGSIKPHVFHGRCMERVLETKPFCPLCRRGLYPWSSHILRE